MPAPPDGVVHACTTQHLTDSGKLSQPRAPVDEDTSAPALHDDAHTPVLPPAVQDD